MTRSRRAGATHAAKSSQVGWIRLTHLSPNTPPVDAYLCSFGGQKAIMVLKHVAYGTVPRTRSSPAASTPSPCARRVRSRAARRCFPPACTCSPAALHDRLTTPKGKSLVRVIQASLRDHQVTVTARRQVLDQHLALGDVTGYGPARPGDWMVHVSRAAGMASQSVKLSAGTIHTLVVLDGACGGLMLDNQEDAAGSAIPPQGGAATGLGGTAPVPAPSAAPWAGRDDLLHRCGVLAAPGQAPGPSRPAVALGRGRRGSHTGRNARTRPGSPCQSRL